MHVLVQCTALIVIGGIFFLITTSLQSLVTSDLQRVSTGGWGSNNGNVAKSLGYCPSELVTCHMSPKSDVYSYGIVCFTSITVRSQHHDIMAILL